MFGPMLSAVAIRTQSLPICLKIHTALSLVRHHKGEHGVKLCPINIYFFQILHVLHLLSKITKGVWSPHVSFCCLWSSLHFCWHKADAALCSASQEGVRVVLQPSITPVGFGRQSCKIHVAWNLMLSAGAGRQPYAVSMHNKSWKSTPVTFPHISLSHVPDL